MEFRGSIWPRGWRGVFKMARFYLWGQPRRWLSMKVKHGGQRLSDWLWPG